MGPATPMGSSHERGSLGGRVQRCNRRKLRSWELIRRSGSVRRVKFGSELGEGCPDRKLLLDFFQEGLAEVANAEHLGSGTIE